MDLESKKALSSTNNRATATTSLDSLQGDALQQDCGGLSVEDYLDFSNEDIDSGENISGATPLDEAKHQQQPIPTEGFRLQKPSPLQIHQNSHSLSFLEGSAGVYCMPCEDIAHLEWLSNFVEESFSTGDGALLLGTSNNGEHKPEQHTPPQRGDSPVSVLRCGAAELQRRPSSSITSSQKCNGSIEENSSCSKQGSNPSRARSKRCRAAVCFWNTRILSLTDDCSILTEGLAASTSCKTGGSGGWSSSSSESDAETYWGVTASAATSKRVKAKTGSKQLPAKVKQQQQQNQDQAERRCLHCGSQRTPQWRAGPMGPKTLCNACGVRYKSGRLLPEYRPAASPTFVETIHSNSHRRVLEMRRQRAEVSTEGDQQRHPVPDESSHHLSVLTGAC